MLHSFSYVLICLRQIVSCYVRSYYLGLRPAFCNWCAVWSLLFGRCFNIYVRVNSIPAWNRIVSCSCEISYVLVFWCWIPISLRSFCLFINSDHMVRVTYFSAWKISVCVVCCFIWNTYSRFSYALKSSASISAHYVRDVHPFTHSVRSLRSLTTLMEGPLAPTIRGVKGGS